MLLNGMQKVDITGQRFGRITVVAPAASYRYPGGKSVRYWQCRCDCGTDLLAIASNLKQRPDPSCGCLHKQKLSLRVYRHGDANKARIWGVWRGMRQRCLNPNNTAFKNYGGRGITIDPRWDDYKAFRAWALSSGYADDLTIERKDNNGNYTPENCCWIPHAQQSRNRRPRSKKNAL